MQILYRTNITIGLYNTNPLQHGLQVISDLERSSSLAADLVNRDTLRELSQSETLGRADVEHGEISDDLPDAAGAGQRERAFCDVLVETSHGIEKKNLPGRILGLPFLSTCSIVTTTRVFSGLATRSMAPPMPLTLPGSMKLARSVAVSNMLNKDSVVVTYLHTG